MDIGIVAKRYAKALLNYAVEEHSEDTVYKEMLQFARNYRAEAQIGEVLRNPLLEAEKKQQIICSVSSDDASPVLKRFAKLLAIHHREPMMLFIAYSYISQYRVLKKISIGHLTTAVPVTEKVSKRLEDWLEAQTRYSTDVIMHTEVNPDIMGGFVFEIDDWRMDASVASQFNLIKQQFIEKNKRII